MVLEDASSPSDESSYDAFPPVDNSTGDPRTKVVEMEVDLDLGGSLPRPLPILGPFFGWGNRRLVTSLQANMQRIANATGRAPTKAETEAMAMITAKEVRTMSYATPMGVAAGVWRARNTQDTWRFPFYKMPEGFNPEIVKVPGVGILFTGPSAKYFWRMARGTAYCSVALFLTTWLVLPYASTVAAVSTTTDPRLKDFREALRQRIQENQWNNKRTAGSSPSDRPTRSDGQWSSEVGNPWENRPRTGEEFTGQDDASPTGGQLSDTYKSKDYHQSGFWDTSAGDQGSQGRLQSRPAMSEKKASSNQGQNTNEAINPSSSQYFDTFDDASPTASYPPASRSSSTSGSAWDRIRQSSQNPTTSPAKSESTKGGKSYRNAPSDDNVNSQEGSSFSSADEDRQLARSEAQKDFDEILERERQGSDFGSSGGYRGGRR